MNPRTLLSHLPPLFLPLALMLAGPAGAAPVAPAKPAAGAPVEADLSKHLVAITTGFSGTSVLLFGAIESPGDVVVVVRGPGQTDMVRRKQREAGIWINSGEAEIADAPSFYQVAANRPLAAVTTPEVLARHRIGLDNLNLAVDVHDQLPADDYRQALIRLKQKRNLYGDQITPISFLGSRLFRTEVALPANVPVGTYSVEVYFFRDGKEVSSQITPLTISKIGIGAEVFDFAHDYGAAYGIMAIAVAALAGWLAALAFRKG